MPETGKNHDSDSGPQLPNALRDELTELYAPPAEVARSVDHAILASARAKFARQRRLRLVTRLAPVAAAAAIVLLFTVAEFGSRQSSPDTPVLARQIREDIDRNGRVDILDAFLLARHIQSPDPPPADCDVTGDRAVDQADVDAVALVAVSLAGG